MKSQFNKILIVTFVILFFTLSKSYSIEDVTEFTDAINEAREEFNNVPEASTEQSKIIDEVLKEIDKATEYAQGAINDNNAEDAIKTLEFIEKTLTDVQSIIPQEFGSDMSKIDIAAIPKEDMATITEVTAQMKTAKEKKENDFMSDLIEINLKGIDTASISEKLNDLGVDTIKLDLVLDKDKKIETWTKKDWADSYKGSILTSDGQKVVTDKEISSRMTELEEKFQKNTLQIEGKRNELSILNNQLNPISSELESLNEKKSLLTSQYNIEISKKFYDKDQKSIELSEKLKNELENINSEALKVEQESALLKTEISSLNKSLNEQILEGNKIREDINNLTSNKLELTETIALKSAKLNELKGQSPNLSSNSNIANLTAKLEDSEKLKSELSNLQSQIENKNLIVSQKISQVNSLNTKLNPLADQINLLNEKKENLQKQYNSELTNISNSFNPKDLSKSEELAANLNNEINLVSNEIRSIEANSSQIKTDISQLDLEISTEQEALNKISIELANSQKELNNIYASISSKESQLDTLLNNDLAKTNDALNLQLNQITREKDFIEAKFEKSIDKEVEALEIYVTALGNVDSKYFAEEVEFSVREVGVILDADPRKARAFEIEKWGTYAGLSKDMIQSGINAVNNDDWDSQEKVYRDIINGMSKNPEWVVDVPTDAEIRVMMAEEKAIQEAALASLNIEEINRNWKDKLNEQAKEFEPLARLDTNRLKYYAINESMAEYEPLAAEINKVLNNDTELKNLTAEIEEKQKELQNIKAIIELNTQEINKQIKPLQEQLSSNYSELNAFNQEYYKKAIEKADYLKSIGGSFMLQRDRGNPNYSEWVRTTNKFDQELGAIYNEARSVETDTYKIQSEIYQIQMKNAIPATEITGMQNLQREVLNLSFEKIDKEKNALDLAKSNVIAQVEEAQAKYNEIMSQENPEYKAVQEKVSSILKGVPTFADKADSLAGTDAATLRAALNDLSAGTTSEVAALEAAKKAMSEIGKTPASQFMTGPTWEMSNVKAAAIVRSKRYDWVDDYEYINAQYRDPLQISTADRKEVEAGFKEFLGNDNPKLNALNKQAGALTSEIAANNAQLTNINANISTLEKEISAIKSSEKDLKSQITKLNKDLTSKQSLINGKNKSLTDLQNNLDPINNKISELEAKKNDLNNNIQNQIDVISQNTKKSEEIAQKTLELENKLSKEISEIDQQINGYKKETEKLTVNISSLNNEILNLENEKPDLSNKISKINKELAGYSNVKAELSVLTAEQKTEVANIDTAINKLESELSDLKTSESQINQQLASLSNELKSKEGIIKNNNLSISKIQKQIDPLNSQIETLENQKASLNEQFNKDLAELSNQIEQKAEARSVEMDKLKADFETQISSIDEEINNFENKANELNRTVTALNDEIKSIEVDTPQITNQIAKLSKEMQTFDNIKANLAMATAKNIGIKVDEKAMKSLGKLDGKAIVSIKGTELVRVVDEKLLKDQANKFIDPTFSKFSLNAKIYTAEAVIPEFFIAEEITTTYSKAKTAREIARENLAVVESKPGASKEEIQVAEAAVAEAKYAEIAAGQAFISNRAVTSAVSPQQTLEKLRSIASTPGMNKWDVRRANAAVKAFEAQIAGGSYNYNQAANKIANDEKKWNVWRADLYKKDIEAAKASGKVREAANLQRDLERFETRLVDERKAMEAAQTQQSNYLRALNSVSTKNSLLSGVSFGETTKAVNVQSLASASSEKKFTNIVDAKNMTQEQARAAYGAKEAGRAVDQMATLSRDTSALQAVGATTQQASAYAAARSARIEARADWDAAMASGNKAAAQAAEDAFMAAREAETVAGRAAAAAAATASVSAAAASAAAQEVTTEVAEAAQEAAQAAQEVTTEVAQAAQEATRDAQQAALDALWEVEAAANNTFDVFRATAAIRQIQSEMNNNSFDYKGASSYEEAIKAIDEMEEKWNAGDKSAIKHGMDPNRIGKCGKSSC